jgi:hypothetical protein
MPEVVHSGTLNFIMCGKLQEMSTRVVPYSATTTATTLNVQEHIVVNMLDTHEW